MAECPHNSTLKVIDRLGMMRELEPGHVTAPLLEWHYECIQCHATISTHRVADPTEEVASSQGLDLVTAAGSAIARAIAAVQEARRVRQGEPNV